MVDIPIRNIWVLQFYASELFRTSGYALVDPVAAPDDLPDLVGRLLACEVQRRLHRGLSVGFTDATRNEHRVRGRINHLPTARGQLLARGQVSCTFDEIVTDTPGNRLVRAALERAATFIPTNPVYRTLAARLETAGVRGSCPPLSQIPGIRRQGRHHSDTVMLGAAELLMTLAIPSTDEGQHLLPSPARDDPYLRRLFEQAAYRIYWHHLSSRGWKVRHGVRQNWNVTDCSAGGRAVLPNMQLDIVLEQGNPEQAGSRRIVIDTKFTSVTKAARYREHSLSSGYLYQMYAYLMSQADAEIDNPSEGLMLHPVVAGHFDEEFVIQGRRIRFATVDLSVPAKELVTSFLELICPSSRVAAD